MSGPSCRGCKHAKRVAPRSPNCGVAYLVVLAFNWLGGSFLLSFPIALQVEPTVFGSSAVLYIVQRPEPIMPYQDVQIGDKKE